MTRILKIVMRGFKSFANRTELVFGDKFNCILGPNGSGKSNVLDALCFVLGKGSAKGLRAEKSANLIYNGGKLKKPAKEGEVSIYFDNSQKIFSGFEEPVIKVSRTIKPSGNSKYEINDKVSNKNQVLELLSLARINPDGYNIILQGDIVRLVEMSTEERLKIVQEVAGIGSYEQKKEKAMNELGRVEEKLKEAEIILAERETHLKELKNERNQALKWRDLTTLLKSSKATVVNIEIEKKRNEISGMAKRIAESRKKSEIFRDEIKKLKEDIIQVKKDIDSINQEIERRGEKEQVALHKEVEQLKVDVATSKARISVCEGEIKKIGERTQALDKNHDEIEGKVALLNKNRSDLGADKKSLESDRDLLTSKIEAFKEKNKLESIGELDTEVEKIDRESDEKQKEAQKLREEQQELLREKDKIAFQVQSVDEKITKVIEIKKEHKTEIESLTQKRVEFKKATAELNELINTNSEISAKLGEARRRQEKVQEELSKIQVKDVAMREGGSGNIAHQKILENKASFGGAVYGMVSDLGHVDTKYSLALEVAAGDRIRNIVVEDDKTASECIKYLRENKFGVVTFLPLNKLMTQPMRPEVKALLGSNGVHGHAIDFVSYDNKYKKAFEFIFNNIVVVDTIDVARRIGIGKARMVSLEGDVAEISGSMQGGFRKREGRVTFKEKEVMEALDKFEKETAVLSIRIRDLTKEKDESEEKIQRLRDFKANLEGDIIKVEKSLHLEEGDLDLNKQLKKEFEDKAKKIDTGLMEINMRITTANRGLADMKMKKQSLREKINQLKDPRLLAELNTFTQKLTQVKEDLMKVEGEIKNIDIQIKDILTPEKQKIQDIIKGHTKEKAEFQKEIIEIKDKISAMNVILKEKDEKEKEFFAQFKDLFNKRNKLSEEQQKKEGKIEAQEEEIRKFESKENMISLDEARIKAELAGLEEEFKQYGGVELIKNKPVEELKKDAWDAERRIADLGPVNMKALDVYEAVEKEYNILLEKKQKLGEEKDSVMGMITEIEGKKKELFMKTYDVLKENFKTIFSALTTKGDAYLELENEENPFEAGLRIKVKITTMKFLDIRSLSGGEKTLTALAFLFAIQEFEPASFYVLDEVDAALDKRNSEKLATLVRQYSSKAQYVIISHNDHVISEADNLYGVSMDEHGRSTVVSLKI